MNNAKIGVFFLVPFLVFSTNQVYAFTPSGTIEHEFHKPWHQMFLDTDQITMDIVVENKANSTKVFVSSIELKLLSDPEQSEKRILVDELNPGDKDIDEVRVTLIPGKWQMSVSLHEDSQDCCDQHQYQTWFVVQPVQNFYNFLASIGAIFGALSAIIAVVFQQLNNSRHSRETKEERKHSLKQMDKQNEILQQQTEYQGILEIMKFFNNDENAKKRNEIYEKNREGTLYRVYGVINDNDKETEYKVASVRGMFDNIGNMVHHDYVNKNEFLSMYCGTVIRMYKVLAPHIEYQRSVRPTKLFAIYFQSIFRCSQSYWKLNFPDTPEPEPY